MRTTRLSAQTRFVALLALSVALWWHPLVRTLDVALGGTEYSHILLILPLSLALIYLERKGLRQEFEPSVSLGAALLATALLVAGVAKWGTDGLPSDVRLSLSMFALVTYWIGSVVLCFGMRAFQALLFPLCFLYGLVPMPAFALDEVTHFLQHQSAFAARVLFIIAGVPVTQDGILLSIPALDIEVSRECSSMRSSAMLVITTMVLAHLFLRSRWRKALLIVAAVPLAAVKNGLRIFVISELGTRVDPGFFDGRLHHQGGIIFFAISLTVMAALLWVLRRTESTGSQGLKAASLQ